MLKAFIFGIAGGALLSVALTVREHNGVEAQAHALVLIAMALWYGNLK